MRRFLLSDGDNQTNQQKCATCHSSHLTTNCDTAQGGIRKERRGHGLSWAFSCACLADDRTAATCWIPLKGGLSEEVYGCASPRPARGNSPDGKSPMGGKIIVSSGRKPPGGRSNGPAGAAAVITPPWRGVTGPAMH